jgi:hypothetical protein
MVVKIETALSPVNALSPEVSFPNVLENKDIFQSSERRERVIIRTNDVLWHSFTLTAVSKKKPHFLVKSSAFSSKKDDEEINSNSLVKNISLFLHLYLLKRKG